MQTHVGATMRWFMDCDPFSGLWYLIPVSRTGDWQTWIQAAEIYKDRKADTPPPDFARRIEYPSAVEFSYPEPR